METLLKQILTRLDTFEAKMDKFEDKFEALDSRMHKFEDKFENLDLKVDAIMEQVAGLIEWRSDVTRQLDDINDHHLSLFEVTGRQQVEIKDGSLH